MSLNGRTATQTDTVLGNDGYWPTIKVQEFIDLYRLPAEYKVELITRELLDAMRVINVDLVKARAVLAKVLNKPSLSEVEPDLIAVYQRAVMSYARTRLVRYFETLNRKSAAEVQGERADEIGDAWLFDSNASIDRINRAFMTKARALGADADDCVDADGFRAVAL